jgi:hypothetical protein
MDFPVPLGQLAQAAARALFAITAAAQVRVLAEVATLVIAIVLAAVAATFAIAVGLVGREVTRAQLDRGSTAAAGTTRSAWWAARFSLERVG